MQKKKILIIALIVFLSLAAFKTVSPAAEASKASLLGYKSFCSFAPISTLILITAAFGTFVASKRTILGGKNKT